MQGIVLCGGQSMRMGKDKALLNTAGVTWAQNAADKLLEIPLTVSFSVNEHQNTFFKTLFSDAVIIKDDNNLQLHGPLLGILSVHLQYPTEDIFVLACDMQLMESATLIELHHLYQTKSGADAYIFTNENEPEPLCGIYCVKGLSSILQMFTQNNLPKYSMKFILTQLDVCYVPIADKQKGYFSNFNSPADLNGG